MTKIQKKHLKKTTFIQDESQCVLESNTMNKSDDSINNITIDNNVTKNDTNIITIENNNIVEENKDEIELSICEDTENISTQSITK